MNRAAPAFDSTRPPRGGGAGLLAPAFLDELRSRTTLSALIGRTVKLQKAGREYKAPCPFHHEKTPSFYVNDEKGFYHCLAADTVVLTRRGRIPIVDLAGRSAEVLGPSGRWIEAPFAEYGEHRLWEIDLTRNGVRKSIFATSKHRWFINGRKSEVLTRDLANGSRLMSATPAARSTWEIEPAGVRHGIVFGDGTMYLGVYGTINLHGPANMTLASWFPDQRAVLKERAPDRAYLKIYGGRAFSGMKDLPPADSSDAYLLGFLAGYLAADGHVAKDGTVILNSARREHLEAVRDIASALGIITYGLTTQTRQGIDGRMSDIHRIHFATSSLVPEIFLKEEARRRFTDHAKAFDRLRWTVRSVTPTDRIEQVYCAQVPGDHAFALDDNILTGNCFGCSAHGDAIRWLTDQQGMGFVDAVKELAQAAGMAMPAPDRQAAEKAERDTSLRGLVEQAATWFGQQLAGVGGAQARAYLERRGIAAETAAAFNLGFAPDTRGRLREAFKTEGDARLIDAGLLISVEEKEPYDRFRGRLMIPIRDARGRTIAFGGRVIGDGEPKYLNSPETALFDKGRTLYNLDRAAPAARKSGRIIVVEGYLDVIALDQAGIAESVAPLGTALTEGQLELLWRQADVPILCFDGDKAGKAAAIRAAIRALPGLQSGRSLSFVTLPGGQDPDDIVRSGGKDAFEKQLKAAEPLVELLWRHEHAADTVLATPEDRAALGRRVREHARSIRDEDIRTQYLAFFNDRLTATFDALKSSGRFQAKEHVPPELREITDIGIDQAVMAPSLIAGLLRFPLLIARHAEVFAQLAFRARRLRQLREAMLDAALGEPQLEPAALDAILRKAGLADTLERLDRKTGLAFSFLRRNADRERGERDLTVLMQALSERWEADAALTRATAVLAEEPSERAFAEQRRLRALRERLEAALAAMAASGDEPED